MKLALVNSRVGAKWIDLHHSVVSRPEAQVLRLAEHTQLGRILLACVIAGVGLQCLPVMMEKPTSGLLDGAVFYGPVAASVLVAVLVAFRERSLVVDGRSRRLSVESWLGPIRIRRSVEPMGRVGSVALASEYVEHTDAAPYWLYTVSADAQIEVIFYARGYRLALTFGRMLTECLSADFADYSEPESRE